MKQIIYLLAILPIFFLWNCSSDDDGFQPTPPEEGNQIKFEIGFAPQNDGKPQTRVATAPDFASTWENGDKIGLYIVKGTTGLQASSNWVDNLEMSYNGTNWTYTLPSGKEYYPNDDDKLSFYAYYPYQANVDPTAFAFAVKGDQSGTEYNKSDFLWAKEENVAKSANAVSLQFTHALSLVQVKIVGQEVNVPHFDNTLTVTLTNVQTEATFNWTTATGTGAATDIVMHKVAGMDNTYRALVPAQTIAKGKQLFSFVQTTTGKAFSFEYANSATTTLTAGKVAQHNITLGWGIDPDWKYAIGDPYPHKGRVIGLVYKIENEGKNGMIVSLDEGLGRWGDPNVNEMNAGVTGIQDPNDGSTATKNLIEKRKNDPNFPTNYSAFNWIYQTKNKGDATGIWYLPAKDELKALYAGYSGRRYEDIMDWGDYSAMPGNSDQAYIDARATFNAKLSAAGGTAFSRNHYWSSSENDGGLAWIVYFSVGTTAYSSKYLGHRLRAVSAF